MGKGDYEEELFGLKNISQFRTLNTVTRRKSSYIYLEDEAFLNFSSNDYLGLTPKKSYYKEFFEGLSIKEMSEKYQFSSSSSRLLTGNTEIYLKLEDKLKTLYQKEAALVFNSGYHANIGIISALAQKSDVIFSDRLNHASMIDGLKLSDADFFRYRHNDLDALKQMLLRKRKDYNKAWIVSESVFSMDGDIADLKGLVELKKQFDCFLYVDEAHGAGVFGKKGLGLCEEEDVINEIDILMGTFGKALAGLGAYAVMDRVLKDFLINKMRPFIFTTALPPIQLLWNLFILRKIPFLSKRRERLFQISKKLKEGLISKGYSCPSQSQIVPLIIGENEKMLEIATLLKKHKILASAVRPPTVPKNTSRLRFSLTASLKEEHIDKILKVVPINLEK